MSTEFIPTNDVKEFVEDILLKYNIASPVHIKYYPGSEIGDGFASKTVAVDIRNGTKSLNLFLKYALNCQPNYSLPMDKFYANETYFYDVVYPAFKQFLTERNTKNPFNNVPKCYGTSIKNIVALENLKKRNFVLFDKTIPMNDEHLTSVLKVFAKFHAISFCFKDQQPERYEEIVKGTYDSFSKSGKALCFDRILQASITGFLSKLDPIKDKDILDACSGKVDDLINAFLSVDQTLDEYSILTQGDCWVNNMMFLYKDNSKEIPEDIMLIDWQVVRPASPVYDISYFFYTIASKTALSKLTDYLKIYHQELSKQIRELGSDPNVLYPYDVLQKEWKQHGKYGFTMAFIVLKAMFYSKEEMPNMDNMDFKQMEEHPELMFPEMKDDGEYLKRLRNLAVHVIENSFL